MSQQSNFQPLFPLDFPGLTALIESQKHLTYDDLKKRVSSVTQVLKHTPNTPNNLNTANKKLIFLFSENTIASITAYLGAVNGGHAVCLLDETVDEQFKKELITAYHPHLIFSKQLSTNILSNIPYHRIDSHLSEPVLYALNDMSLSPPLHPELQLLLTTSGTTGSPKLVRLSKKQILSNASSIISYLRVTKSERAMMHLPFHYSYGLSVLHTHLLQGASLVLPSASVVQQGFWSTLQQEGCTSLAAVPYTIQMIDRMRIDLALYPSLTTLTQAGGHLDKELVLKYSAVMQKKGGRFVVMYGQTEATARMAYLPPESLPGKAGSIGRAIPGGELSLMDGERAVTTPGEAGELVYRGPNVMLGLAAQAEDLIKGDELHGVLHTGDVGTFDAEGFFYVTGRMKRFAKVYGLRISLDDIERRISSNGWGRAAVKSGDGLILIYLEGADAVGCRECVEKLSALYHLHPETVRCIPMKALPVTAAGKIDYQALKQ